MDRLKALGLWAVLVLAFFIFSNGLIYLFLHGEELGMKIYNMTHKDEIVNVEGQKQKK